MRVASLDDDHIFRFLITELLKSCGVQDVLSFIDTKQALHYLQTHQHTPDMLPNIFLLDLNMPIDSGWDFIEDAQELLAQAQTEVWVITSSDDSRDLQRIEATPLITKTLIKPVALNTLKEQLIDYIENTPGATL